MQKMVSLVILQQSFRSLLSIDYRIIESKKNYNFFKISKYMLLCKMVAMVILHQFLSAGHIMSNVTKQESYL